MTDEQRQSEELRRIEEQRIARDLEALRIDADPNPAFADELFAQLQDEAVAPRRPARAWVLLAAAVLVAALSVGAALGSGLVRLPMLIADASPTPVVSHEPTASTVASPTQTPSDPSSSPSPSATPAAPPLVIDGVARVLVSGLTLRAEPGLQAERLGTLAQDTAAFVVDGPVPVDGYAWYELSALGLPPNTGCAGPLDTVPFNCPSWIGWAAAADLDGSPWLEPTSLVCPESPMNVDTFILARGPYERLACNADGTITIRGWWPGPPEFGECMAGGETDARWLYCEFLFGKPIFTDASDSVISLPINIDPDSGIEMPEPNTWVEVVGHLDDPAAQRCAPLAHVEPESTDADEVVLSCRARFVAESVTPVDGPF